MRRIILRSPTHHLIMAFECLMPTLFERGDEMQPVDVVRWAGKLFVFTTLDESSITYVEASMLEIVEGSTVCRVPDEQLAEIEETEPRL